MFTVKSGEWYTDFYCSAQTPQPSASFLTLQWNLDLTKCQGTGKLVHYIENLDITILWKNNENIRYIEV